MFQDPRDPQIKNFSKNTSRWEDTFYLKWKWKTFFSLLLQMVF